MLIFGMGLYGLFISNVNPDVPADVDRALKGSSLFGMFAMKVTALNIKETHISTALLSSANRAVVLQLHLLITQITSFHALQFLA